MPNRAVLGAGITVTSLVIMGIGLFAIVSSLDNDSVQLPTEGTVEDILDENVEDNEGGTVRPDGSIVTAPRAIGPKPVRMVIPRLFIDAPVAEMGFESESGDPEVPERADLVAWYGFTSAPGLNENAVFSGHVDWQTQRGDPIPGVFYRLRELVIGDVIQVELEGNTMIEYRVTGNVAVEYDDPNVARSFSVTDKDVITLITCGGAWENNNSEPHGGNYTHRIVLRAEKSASPAVLTP
jgi:LPXTG-site transpeptidase (sortase) family protein